LLPAPSFAFIDLETTGTSARDDRITEIGIVRVDHDGDADERVCEWSTLVDPQLPIPPAIQALTGITDEMVKRAPTFSSIAHDLLEMLAGCVLVAHNARFDYGFLKHAFSRLERQFAARMLCTVRLSRRLFPEANGHGLDALITRYALDVPNRHRALGDARAIWLFVQMLYRDFDHAHVNAAIKRILRIPSLPPQLPPDAIESLPEAPGVYMFYGDNPLPLYIGKSVNLRERVGAHFSQDWRNETDLRLSREIRRIEHHPTAGELGALLHEAALIKSQMPAHNRALRRKAEAGVGVLVEGLPKFVAAARLDQHMVAGAYGPFTSRASFRALLRRLASEHRLCWRRLSLEHRAQGPCFARQLRRCNGVCVDEESTQAHDERLLRALEPLQIPRWPFPGPALLRECSDERIDVHVVRDWHWLGTARDDAELAALLESRSTTPFDPDVARLLLRRYRSNPRSFVGAPIPT
jgi:DNA polymerase-3 subunit epsilon